MISTLKTFLLLLILANSFTCSQQINDIIKPLKLISGQADTVIISDLFYADDYDIKIRSTPQINISYAEGLLVLAPQKNYEGLESIPFSLMGTYYHIPVIVEDVQKINFRFNPPKEKNDIFLFGSFNNWNRANLKMTDDDRNGTYEIQVALEPGRYEYKFFVNGEELVDPANPEQLPNGFGGFNSILNVEEKHKGSFYLHNIDMNNEDELTNLKFYLEADSDIDSFSAGSVFAYLNNSLIENESISVHQRYITVQINKKDLASKNIFRIAVSCNGHTSNMQTIFIQDAKPENNDSHFLWQDAIIYSLMIDRFNDGDKSNSIPVQHPMLTAKANYLGGDLQGIINKINEGYFSTLGVNTLWISPVIDNTDSAYQEYPEPHRYYTGYHGYWPVHPTKVEERFGDIELLKKLINTAHSKNIKVLLDYVANHIHIEHPFWKEHRDWFGKLDLPDGRKNLRLWDEQRLTTWFEPYMPSFDFEGSDEALNVMTDNAVWWIKETGADGFRHDAVKHIPNEFWRMLTKKIKKECSGTGKEYVYQVGETFGSYELVSSYVNNGQLDAQFNFNLYDTALPVFIDSTASFKSLDEQMKKTFSVYGVNHLMGNIMDSHDKVRFMSFADKDIALADAMNAGEIGWTNPPEVNNNSSYEKLKVKMTYLQTIPGIPVIYYGDEFGMTGAADPDNRRMMRFEKQLSEIEKQTLNDISSIVNLRKKHTALRYGDFYTLAADKNIYAYLRSDMNERIVTILNKGSEEIQIELKLPSVYKIISLTDLLTGDKFKIENDKLVLNVKPYGYYILKNN